MELTSWKTLVQKITNFKMEKGLYSFVNPYSMLLLKEQSGIISAIDFWHVDGISLVVPLNRFEGLNIKRFSFDDSSLAPVVYQYAKDHNLKIAVIGTKEEYIHMAVNSIQNKFGVDITYYRNGYFKNSEERAECFRTINKLGIDIVICGMGTPYQENFLIELKSTGWFGYGFTCGGYLHQIAKKENYYPVFFDKLNIRWMYRIIDEPVLFSRYFVVYPKFFLEYFKYKVSKL